MIIGREKEQRELLELLDKEESQFCAVYGRRRVGKTYLIRETFNYNFCFQHTGVAKGTLRQQLTAFRNSLVAAGLTKCAIPKTWIEAFELLKRLINNAPAGKKILFIDELPWMDTPKGNLIGALENFWNGWATARRKKDIVLLVCGSATSWISKKLLKDKGGLRGRLTNRIKLVPFTLRECELFAQSASCTWQKRRSGTLHDSWWHTLLLELPEDGAKCCTKCRPAVLHGNSPADFSQRTADGSRGGQRESNPRCFLCQHRVSCLTPRRYASTPMGCWRLRRVRS